MFGIVATLAIANLAACGATIGDGSARPTPSSAPTPSPASRYVPITPLPPSGADVSGAQFVDATHGWALVDSPTLDGCCAAAAPQRLEWTADAGSAWVNITPLAARGATVIGVDFSTDADGWAVIAGDPNLPPLIAHTEDSGRVWTAKRLPPGQAEYGNYGSAAIAFSDPAHGWIVVDDGTNSSTFLGIGYRTADGGRTWTAMSVPALGAVYFATASTGWIFGNWAPGGGFFVTHNGGDSWVASSVPAPSGYAADTMTYGPPGSDLFSAGSPVVDAAFSDPTTGTVVAVGFYVSPDLGRSWSLSALYKVPAPGGNTFSLAIVSGSRWYLAPPEWPNGSLVTTADGGGVWTARESPAPEGAVVSGLTFGDSDHGWSLVTFSGCLMFKSDCFSATRLYGTLDGAVSWRLLNP